MQLSCKFSQFYVKMIKNLIVNNRNFNNLIVYYIKVINT